jgi:hypothetical protein
MKETQYEGDLSRFWENFTYDWHVYRQHEAADEYSPSFRFWQTVFKTIIFNRPYTDVLGLLQRILRCQNLPYLQDRPSSEFCRDIARALHIGQAAYRVLDEDTIVPVGSDNERETIEQAFTDLSANEFFGARKHLRTAAEELTAGHNAASIRESIHAVESVVRILEPEGDFSRALAKLEAKTAIHGAMKAGFKSLYGFTSDENGIRHPLLEKDSAAVDETDALFMIGACAAFVSYLIGKARNVGLLTKPE